MSLRDAHHQLLQSLPSVYNFSFLSFATKSQLKEPTAERNIDQNLTHLELRNNILYLNTMGFKSQSSLGRVQIKLIKPNLTNVGF